MPAPFKVRDQDRPGVDLGEWTEDGGIRLPGQLQIGVDGGVSFANANGQYDTTIARTGVGQATLGGVALIGTNEADSLAVGQFIPPRRFCTSVVPQPAGSGHLNFGHFTADKTETLTTMTLYTGSVAAGATPTLCRFGIYSVAANGDLTLVASVANDTTLFAATNTAYPRAFTTPFTKVAGQRYATGLLVVTAATMPSFHGLQLASTAVSNATTVLVPAIISRIVGQSDLPATVAVGATIGYQSQVAVLIANS